MLVSGMFRFWLKNEGGLFLGVDYKGTTRGLQGGNQGTTPIQQVGNRRTNRGLRCLRGGAISVPAQKASRHSCLLQNCRDLI